jgi:hypothetical protein
MSENLSTLLQDIGLTLSKPSVNENISALLIQNLPVKLTHLTLSREKWLIKITSRKISIFKPKQVTSSDSSSIIEFCAFDSELSNYEKNEVPCFPVKNV